MQIFFVHWTSNKNPAVCGVAKVTKANKKKAKAFVERKHNAKVTHVFTPFNK